MDKKFHTYHQALEKKREQKEYHQLRCVAAMEEKSERSQLNFSSSDYLGLSLHPYVKKMTIKYVLEWGAGTTPSRLVTEHLECHRSVEEKLAELVGKESSLLFPSSFQAHEQILTTLIPPKATILIDRFCHHKFIQAAMATGAHVIRYEHNQMEELEGLLKRVPNGAPKWILSESLFGMTGEAIDLKHLSEVAKQADALTFIDDSKSVGMMGKHGMGLASHRKGIDVVFGSFGKQSGSFGAYLASNKLFRDYLLAFNPLLIETTTLPPAVLGAISGALDLIPDMQVEREKVGELSNHLWEKLQESQWEMGESTSHLIPILCFSDQACQKLSAALLKASILATALRPPMVPRGAARLIFAINALHTHDHIEKLITTLNQLREEPSLSTV